MDTTSNRDQFRQEEETMCVSSHSQDGRPQPNVNKPEWEPITLMVDSGASDTVVNPKLIPTAGIQPSAGSNVGLEYEVANGESIPNLEEKHLAVVPHGGASCKSLKVQCAEVR